MHNLYARFVKILEICKKIGKDLVNKDGNIPRRGVVPKFSDLEVLSLSMTSESLGIDSEVYLFSILKGYKKEFPNLISRRQYNDRRKFTRNLCETIRKRMADSIDGGEDYFCIDSKPIEVCRVARGKRCTMGKNDYSKAPSFGYCASQKSHYYGYKLHVLCGLSGVIHSYDLTKASVHDINYLQDIKLVYHDCSISGLYSGVMRYMQYVVYETGPSNIYIKMSDDASRPSPSNNAYSYYYSTFGLRLDNLVNTTIPGQADPEKYNDIKAIAQILLNHQQWTVLDCLGAAPITEAFKNAQGITTPRYDLYQESIREDKKPMYKVIDEEVKAAVTLLKQSNDTQVNLGNADFFYNGDVAKWIKFGNTLRVKMAQRVEKRDAAFYEAVIGEVLTSASNVIDSNEASCIYWHPNDYNNNRDDIQDITGRYCAAAAFVNYLEAYNDPRLPLLIRPNGFGLNNNNESNDEWFTIFNEQNPGWEEKYPQFVDRYSGMSANPDSISSIFHKNEYLSVEYKKEDGNSAMMDIRMHSQVEARYFIKNGGDNGNNNMPARDIEDSKYEFNQDDIKTFNPILTYPETCLMIAEIAFKKGTAVAGKDATAWMKEGIKASMEQYKSWAVTSKVLAEVDGSDTYNPITEEKIAAYLAQPEFQTATLEKIISQQWINLYRQPQEMWNTWKRTGLPAFKAQPEPEAGVAFLEEIRESDEELIIPRRNGLGTPNTLNIENYNIAVQALVSDSYYGKATRDTEGRIWWDVNDL